MGAGSAGYRAAQTLSRLARGRAEIVLVNPTDYFLYLPLLPEVAAAVLEPRRVTVSLAGTLPDVRLVLGSVHDVNLAGRRVRYTDPEDGGGELDYHRLVLAAGSVNKLLPVPGVSEHAHGFRGIPEALYLRDHVIRQIELADAAQDPAGRGGPLQLRRGRRRLHRDRGRRAGHPVHRRARPAASRLAGHRPRWLLLDVADRVLSELDPRMSRVADRVLRERGVDVRTGVSVEEATGGGVRLTDGGFVATRSVVWCVGVRPDPLVADLGLELRKGRIVVDEYLSVPGHPQVYACGDAAAVRPHPPR